MMVNFSIASACADCNENLVNKPLNKNAACIESNTSSKCLSAEKTGFGQNGRQAKCSPGRGGNCLLRDCFLCSKNHIGTQKCSKFVVKCEKIVVLRGFRGYFEANSGSAVANK